MLLKPGFRKNFNSQSNPFLSIPVPFSEKPVPFKKREKTKPLNYGKKKLFVQHGHYPCYCLYGRVGGLRR